MISVTRDNWIVLGVAAAMVASATIVVFVRQGRQLDQLHARIAAQENDLKAEADKVAVVPDMIRQVETLKDHYSGFDRKLPKSKELNEFLLQISKSLSQAKLSNQSIEPGNPTKQDYFNTLPIIMRFHGTYLSLADFMSNMESMERLSRVQKLIVASDEKSKDLNIELQMNIYFTES